jgi:hypothetical protein
MSGGVRSYFTTDVSGQPWLTDRMSRNAGESWNMIVRRSDSSFGLDLSLEDSQAGTITFLYYSHHTLTLRYLRKSAYLWLWDCLLSRPRVSNTSPLAYHISVTEHVPAQGRKNRLKYLSSLAIRPTRFAHPEWSEQVTSQQRFKLLNNKIFFFLMECTKYPSWCVNFKENNYSSRCLV